MKCQWLLEECYESEQSERNLATKNLQTGWPADPTVLNGF